MLYDNLRPYPPSVAEYPFLKGIHTGTKNPFFTSFWLPGLLVPVFRLRSIDGPATLEELLSPGPTTQLYLEVLYEHPPANASWLQRNRPIFRFLRGLAKVFFDEDATMPVAISDYYPGAIVRLWGVPAADLSGDEAVEGSGGSLCLGCSPKSPPGRLEVGKGMVACNTQAVEAIGGKLCVFEILKVMEIERLLREEKACTKRTAGWAKRRRNPVPEAWGVTGFPLRDRLDLDIVVRQTLALCLDARLLFGEDGRGPGMGKTWESVVDW
ncbi:hypothetical protein BJ508DRAFT_329552 [Ascobolus immersus RN42]|uniref:Uncharacterized protein n=1 Tax=Ascobolus immersus RN42 TaxID=1160509 RepID=A0A3N4HWD1_ASCIM|nr:hypothetical protein BJ508DRAFT_329552 [Ascobolus immersus RN42]